MENRNKMSREKVKIILHKLIKLKKKRKKKKNSLDYLREFTLSKSKNKRQRGRQPLSWILKHRIRSAEKISEASPPSAGLSFPAQRIGFSQRENPGKKPLPSISGVGGKAEPGRQLGGEGAASLL